MILCFFLSGMKPLSITYSAIYNKVKMETPYTPPVGGDPNRTYSYTTIENLTSGETKTFNPSQMGVLCLYDDQKLY